MRALTGKDPELGFQSFKRTGTPGHRESSSRQSAASYIANSPTYATRMIISTDTQQDLANNNYDFMFQASMLYAQQISGDFHNESPEQAVYHFHIQCTDCLREVSDINLSTTRIYQFSQVHDLLDKWKPVGTKWFIEKPVMQLPVGAWNILTPQEHFYHIGRAQGFFYSDLIVGARNNNVVDAMFPLSLLNKLWPQQFLEGLMDGIYRACCLHILSKRHLYRQGNHWRLIVGSYTWFVSMLTNDTGFLLLMDDAILTSELSTLPHKIPASYPASRKDLAHRTENYLMHIFDRKLQQTVRYIARYPDL